VKLLRRLLRPVKVRVLRIVEFRRGIMLVTAVPPHRGGAREATCRVSLIESLPADSPLEEAKVLQRWSEGHFLYGIVIDDALITQSWVSGAGAAVGVLHSMVLEVPNRSIYIWDGSTRPDQRSRGLHQQLLRGIVERHPGIDVAYAAVDVNNAPSIRALTKAGFRPLFRYYGLKLFNRPVLAVARTAKGLGPAQRSFDQITEEARRSEIIMEGWPADQAQP
jgi:ribosomal protein S18 acetylase RimI-like enzyme